MRLCILIIKDDRINWCERHQRHHEGNDLELSQAATQAGARVRIQWDAELKGEPSILQKPRTLSAKVQAMLDAPVRLTHARLLICNGCPEFVNQKCRQRRCGMVTDPRSAFAKCPLRKWNA
jgi:hypothetical protein